MLSGRSVRHLGRAEYLNFDSETLFFTERISVRRRSHPTLSLGRTLLSVRYWGRRPLSCTYRFIGKRLYSPIQDKFLQSL